MDAVWTELYTGDWIVTGNVAKVRVQQELRKLFDRRPGARVLDVGCIGPHPLEFWEPLMPGTDFHLTGVDVGGIEKGEEVARRRGWQDRVELRVGSGYQLASLFPPESFDVLVATQVLEHVARLDHFMAQVAAVLRPGGEAFFTLDSAHWLSRYTPAHPVRLAKNVVKKLLSVVGNERHYDLPWYDHEIAAACERAGLGVREVRYYNLPHLKQLHNSVLPAREKNDFMRRWMELEDRLNAVPEVRERGRGRFMVLYVHARKRG